MYVEVMKSLLIRAGEMRKAFTRSRCIQLKRQSAKRATHINRMKIQTVHFAHLNTLKYNMKI